MWQHKDAADYVKVLEKVYGEPDVYSDSEGGIAIWYNPVRRITEVIVRDENILHTFPMEHTDFVYASMEIKVSPKMASWLAYTSGSIIVDGLKGIVTARCGKMTKNGVTLGFVEDLINGRLDPELGLKDEYAKRIREDEIPVWYTDID